MLLGVNIDHVATLREARKINDPDPLEAVFIAKSAGAHQVTVHLREDRRHIHDFDLERIIESSFLPVNLECAIDPEMIQIACQQRPQRVTLVPEKREEVTTEGGLDVEGQFETIQKAVKKLQDHEIEVSLFIDPDVETVQLSQEVGASMIELHTGRYANLHLMLQTNLARTHHRLEGIDLPRCALKDELRHSLQSLKEAAVKGKAMGLEVAAGHGLNRQNVKAIVHIQEIFELNIGHSIIARSVMVGLERAIKEMLDLM